MERRSNESLARAPVATAAAIRGIILLVVLAGSIAGCIHEPPEIGGRPAAARGPGEMWSPPPEAEAARAAAQATPAIPEGLAKKAGGWTLSDVVDLALRNNPATRASWASARAAAHEVGSKRGAYLPSVDAEGSVSYLKETSARAGRSAVEQTIYGPEVSLSYLLLDLGGRSASLDAAKQTLFAADWTHNATVQDVVLEVEKAYYRHQAARALREARKTSREDARIHLEAAEERRRAGVATVADELQAKTALSQADLALETAEGALQTARGDLAAAMGLPAHTPYDIEPAPGEVPILGIAQTVDKLIGDSIAKRPDLAAARAEAEAARARVREARSKGLPFLTARGSVEESFVGDSADSAESYAATLNLVFPLFRGASQTYEILQAEELAEEASERARSLEQEVQREVWTSYHDLQTATRRVGTTGDLIASATESHEVALGRYREGLGSILDLLTAESALADARAQEVQSRWDWHTALAQLARDAGVLGLDGGSNLARAGAGPAR